MDDGNIGELTNQSWDQAHAVEIKFWLTVIKRVREASLLPEDALANPEGYSLPHLGPALFIISMAEYIRNRTFHREEYVSEYYGRLALKIPRMLNDHKRAEELETIYETLINDPTLDEPSSQSVRDILFAPHPESGTSLQVEAKMLSMLEEDWFCFAEREDPEFLTRKFWGMFEYGEIQIYASHWVEPPAKYRSLAEATEPGECVDLDGQFFMHPHLREQFLKDATGLRNSVSHRNISSERSVCFSAWSAILCFILMGDRIRAIEVESLVEAFLTKTSRTDALLRLYNASWNDEPSRRDAIFILCRREGIEANRCDSTKREGFPISPRPSSDKGSRWPELSTEISKSAKANESVSYGTVRELWYSAVHRFAFYDSMHEALRFYED